MQIEKHNHSLREDFVPFSFSQNSNFSQKEKDEILLQISQFSENMLTAAIISTIIPKSIFENSSTASEQVKQAKLYIQKIKSIPLDRLAAYIASLLAISFLNTENYNEIIPIESISELYQNKNCPIKSRVKSRDGGTNNSELICQIYNKEISIMLTEKDYATFDDLSSKTELLFQKFINQPFLTNKDNSEFQHMRNTVLNMQNISVYMLTSIGGTALLPGDAKMRAGTPFQILPPLSKRRPLLIQAAKHSCAKTVSEFKET